MNVQELIDEIILRLPDNTSGAITPEILRNILTEFANRSEIKTANVLNITSEADEILIEAFSLLTLRSLNQLVDIISIDANNSLRIDGVNGEIKMKAGALLEAIIGGQINLTSGDSTTIEAGADLILKSTLNNTYIEATNGIVDLMSVNNNTKIIINGIDGKIDFKSTVGHYNFNNIPIYTNDASADADAGLLSGSFYKLTGNRTIFQKP